MHTIVGVLRGGRSNEHDVSLKTGAAIIASLPDDRFITRDIYIDTHGEWIERGRATTPESVLPQVDVAIIALHGEGGDEQKALSRFGVPYAGSDAFSSQVAQHKLMSKIHAREIGLLTPDFRYAESRDDADAIAHEVIRSFEQPVVVKPVGWGSSIGVSIVGGYALVRAAIEELFDRGATGALIEEYVRGREATLGVVEGLRGEDLYVTPALEIVSPAGEHFSRESKRLGTASYDSPGTFSRVATEDLRLAARAIHKALRLRHYSRSDFIVAKGGVYYLETNSSPDLGDSSTMTAALSSVGISPSDFASHLVKLALSR